MVPYCAADILVDRDGMSLYMCVLPLISLYNSLLPFCVSINLLWTSRICDKVCTVYFWTVFITVLFTSFFQKSTEAKFPLPIKSAEGKLYSQWEQTRAGNGSPCHHTDILLRETDGYNAKARRRTYRGPQRTTDLVFMSLAPERTGPLCCWGVGSGPRVGTNCRCQGSLWIPGRGGRGQPWRGPEWCTTEGVCARLCVGAFYITLVNSLYYSYIHRNKNVAGGGGREIQEGGDTRTPMANPCWCMAEIKPILHSNYTSEKRNIARWSGKYEKKIPHIYNHNSVYIWEQAAHHHQTFTPASDV